MDQHAAQNEIARLSAIADGDAGAPVFPSLAEAFRRAGRPKDAERVAREGLRHHPERLAGRVALGLALLDLGRIDEARDELARVLDVEPDHPVAAETLARSEVEGASAASHVRPMAFDAPEQAFEAPSLDVSEALGSEAPALEVDPPELGGGFGSVEPLGAVDDDAAMLSEVEPGELDAAFEDAAVDAEEMLDADGVAAAAARAVDCDEPEGLLPLDEDSPFATETMAELLESQGHAEEAGSIRSQLAEPAPLEPEREPEAAPPRGRRDEIIQTLERWLQNIRRGRA